MGELKSVMEEWIEAGRVTLPVRPAAPLPESPVRSAEGAGLRLLDLDRGKTER